MTTDQQLPMYLKTKDIKRLYNVSATSIFNYKRLQDDPFPQPINNSPCMNLYLTSEVDAWFTRRYERCQAERASGQISNIHPMLRHSTV